MTVYQTWSSTSLVDVELVRRHTTSSSVGVRPTMSAVRVSAVPKVIIGQRKDLTLVLVYHVSVTTELIRVILSPEPASSVPQSTVY